MPKFQKESFLKSFLLFFVTMEIFLVFIFYNYSNVEKHHLENNIFLEMKNYSYIFESNKFDIDIVSKKNQKLYELQKDNKYLYIYISVKNQDNDLLKIIYPIEKFNNELSKINNDLIFKFLILSIISFIISIVFAYYSLYPLQKSYIVLKEFMKDIIHDINTPISAMKLNISLIDNKDDEIKSIEQSINILEMLHKNLDNYVKNDEITLRKVNIKPIIIEQIEFFRNIYDHITWNINIQNDDVITDVLMINRAIYNLISNSCKYNISKDGYINISYNNKVLIIRNSSHGIKNPSNVFERFYKEHDRGLGIGLHIVSKILKQLDYQYMLSVDDNNEVTVMVTMQ